MEKRDRIYIAGHTGLVGSALIKRLKREGYLNLIVRTHDELDLTDKKRVEDFFRKEKPRYGFLAAAKVGGILVNISQPAEFIYINLMIQTSVIHAAYLTGVKRLIFFGSNCTYPKDCPQPMEEESLLSGVLERTSEPYAISKIAGMEMCESYNRQYGTQFISVIPATLYGPNDNFELEDSHVLSALIRKFHEVKMGRLDSVAVWGSGTQRREFLYVDDLVDACILLMQLDEKELLFLIKDSHFIINVGMGTYINMMDLAFLIKDIVGCKKDPILDTAKPDGAPLKVLDISKIKSIDWQAKMPLKQGIINVYDWYRNHLEEITV